MSYGIPATNTQSNWSPEQSGIELAFWMAVDEFAL
jgi:hypothetical protein